MISGTVTELHRWPVKSMGGEPVTAFALDGRGVAGDRTHALHDEFKGASRRLTARETPRLLAWHASYDGADFDPGAVPLPSLTAPDGTRYSWDDPGLAAALDSDLDRRAELRRDLRGMQDLGESVLITTQATLDALREELGGELDLRRFRTNIHVELDAPAFAEEEWEGGTIEIGAARLELLHPCLRCAIPTRDPDTQKKRAEILRHIYAAHAGRFGINARPLGPARIAIGDRVRVPAS